MKLGSTPLRSILSDYLHKMMEILESKKSCFRQVNIKDCDKMHNSIAVLDSMKKLFSHEDFLNHISDLLEQPFASFSKKINHLIKNNKLNHSKFEQQEGTQT
mgnify:CR=1 FL=1